MHYNTPICLFLLLLHKVFAIENRSPQLCVAIGLLQMQHCAEPRHEQTSNILLQCPKASTWKNISIQRSFQYYVVSGIAASDRNSSFSTNNSIIYKEYLSTKIETESTLHSTYLISTTTSCFDLIEDGKGT